MEIAKKSGRLMRLDTLIGMWGRGALRGDELKILMARLLAVVAAATRLVRFVNVSTFDELTVELAQALAEVPPEPSPGGRVARLVVHLGCGSSGQEAGVLEQIARYVGAGAFSGNGSTPLAYKWEFHRPEAVGEMSHPRDLVEAFNERHRGWASAVEAALVACEALATAEENAGDSMAMERAEGIVEELEATIGAEAANWWRQRLRELQRERDASISESEAMAESMP